MSDIQWCEDEKCCAKFKHWHISEREIGFRFPEADEYRDKFKMTSFNVEFTNNEVSNE